MSKPLISVASRTRFELVLPQREGGAASVVELPLDGMEDEIATLSARQETLNVLYKVRAEAASIKTQAMLKEIHRQRRMLVLEREEING